MYVYSINNIYIHKRQVIIRNFVIDEHYDLTKVLEIMGCQTMDSCYDNKAWILKVPQYWDSTIDKLFFD